MPPIAALTSFTANTTAQAAQVNSNFSTVRTAVNTYAAWIDVANVFTSAQTFSAAVTTSAGITVNTTGLTLAPQTAITFTHASARVIPGATGLYFRNTANTADNLAITDAGAITVRSSITGITSLAIVGALSGVTTLAMSGALSGVTTLAMAGALSGVTTRAASGVVTLSATGACLTFSGAEPQIKIGVTSLTMVNNAGSGTLSTISQTGHRLYGNSGAQALFLGYASSEVQLTNGSGQVEIGAATTTGATADFPRMPQVAGSPSGAVSNGCFVLDTTASKLWVYNGTWKFATLT